MSKMKLTHNLSKVYGPQVRELGPGELFMKAENNGCIYMVVDRDKINYRKARYSYAVSLKSGFICSLHCDEIVIPVTGTLDVRQEE